MHQNFISCREVADVCAIFQMVITNNNVLGLVVLIAPNQPKAIHLILKISYFVSEVHTGLLKINHCRAKGHIRYRDSIAAHPHIWRYFSLFAPVAQMDRALYF